MSLAFQLLPWLIILALGVYLLRGLWRKQAAWPPYANYSALRFAELANKPKPVTLRMVWRWTCPECQHLNHHGGHALKDEHWPEGMEAVDQNGDPLIREDFVLQPTEVFCAKCEGRYPVKGES
jgi:hypothetical protein